MVPSIAARENWAIRLPSPSELSTGWIFRYFDFSPAANSIVVSAFVKAFIISLRPSADCLMAFERDEADAVSPSEETRSETMPVYASLASMGVMLSVISRLLSDGLPAAEVPEAAVAASDSSVPAAADSESDIPDFAASDSAVTDCAASVSAASDSVSVPSPADGSFTDCTASSLLLYSCMESELSCIFSKTDCPPLISADLPFPSW